MKTRGEGGEFQAGELPGAEFLGGRLLIAMPAIGDPRFERSVILMCTHSADSAMGVILNNPVDGLSLAELLERLEVKWTSSPLDQLVLAGGPVERERGFVIHTDDFTTADATLPVGDSMLLTPTREVLEAIADDGRRPRRSVLALGCAVWGPGQLEQEIRDSAWLACDADEDLLFDDHYDTKWVRALAKIGVAVDHLSSQAGRA
jgi:putative transcriptional regulator